MSPDGAACRGMCGQEGPAGPPVTLHPLVGMVLRACLGRLPLCYGQLLQATGGSRASGQQCTSNNDAEGVDGGTVCARAPVAGRAVQAIACGAAVVAVAVLLLRGHTVCRGWQLRRQCPF